MPPLEVPPPDDLDMPPLCDVSDDSSDEEESLPRSLSQIADDDAEWDSAGRRWGEQENIGLTMSTMAKVCGHCEVELAARSRSLREGTVLCLDCGEYGAQLLCERCCKSEHRLRPLHRIKVWNDGWDVSTLAEGLIVHLGHSGHPCLWPVLPVKPMMVMSMSGVHRVNIRYCGCGQFEAGPVGEWNQILAYGWHRGGLVHSQVCATFPVMTAAQTLLYKPEIVATYRA
ncbi:hypothetical protein DFH06DRAFT_1151226 [Mycena polygramma]|nr:hypothetical protein DFH06DRAFT_1151226 [Mycena polygramma]